MIVLPIGENMNYGKTHAFFTWASADAWVPPLAANQTARPPPSYSYSNVTASEPIPLAKHDPYSARQEWHMTGRQRPWVRPDFVVKVDDDSFVMLAELEARLRVELHTRTARGLQDDEHPPLFSRRPSDGDAHSELPSPSSGILTRDLGVAQASVQREPAVADDPLVYWGYLVKNQFMAGELYGLSWSLVDWVAHDAGVRSMTHGKEDKQVAKWMRAHPRAQDVRWKSERCWIYDHPRAGTVYSHGFLFPSEATRVRRGILSYLTAAPDLTPVQEGETTTPVAASPVGGDGASPTDWAYSSVASFGARYTPPLPDLTTLQGVEALIEGSEMSRLREGGAMLADDAWRRREGRRRRYEEKRVGGTVVVHFIKKNPWFLETALALLEGVEVTELEDKQHSVESGRTTAVDPSRTIARWHRRL